MRTLSKATKHWQKTEKPFSEDLQCVGHCATDSFLLVLNRGIIMILQMWNSESWAGETCPLILLNNHIYNKPRYNWLTLSHLKAFAFVSHWLGTFFCRFEGLLCCSPVCLWAPLFGQLPQSSTPSWRLILTPSFLPVYTALGICVLFLNPSFKMWHLYGQGPCLSYSKHRSNM